MIPQISVSLKNPVRWWYTPPIHIRVSTHTLFMYRHHWLSGSHATQHQKQYMIIESKDTDRVYLSSLFSICVNSIVNMTIYIPYCHFQIVSYKEVDSPQSLIVEIFIPITIPHYSIVKTTEHHSKTPTTKPNKLLSISNVTLPPSIHDFLYCNPPFHAHVLGSSFFMILSIHDS